MAQTYDVKLQARVEELIKQCGSQAKASRILGWSDGVISQYRRSDYERGRVDEVEASLREYFRLQDEAAAQAQRAEPFQPVLDTYIPISVSEDIRKAIRFGQLKKGITILHGDAGIGKTMAAEKYLRDNPNTAVLITVTPLTGTVGNVMKLICRALHIPEGRSKLDMIIDLKERLYNTDKVLIIDEAQHLQVRALDEIRPLSEPHIDGKKGIGIVLIGNSEIYDRMEGRRQSCFAQLYSRKRLTRKYTTKQVTPEDIALLFPALEGKKRELNFLRGICQGRYGIRGGVNVYNNAVDAENIGIDMLTLQAREMGIGII
ncbi:AAA family ATPase [Ethanoligenens harbinense]|uniref:Putative ATPase, transposase-like protein n=1 Tax=Ethanoligenens harbinense (strain DSM 18485 / JCM 12961 / CGMCC 1.5033 / YUAN-3) TaxID=663278 RepID=E6U935_ETHHY|nr:AAA family ATPase [Ethanoligenens harbinense]ADU26099.1 putative ATPase, transposase-like protein [Ethanoligenens harbinense YUAN-3]AVQ95242.1 ATP-binding protein [Ethanoligenens harbinense YUAN-3]AYF37933.1 ATP-binding protein [Ethanoligenens harbinense]AYF40653.1 ATP-binding protein [Ethanoligenens harbinense]QCN91487.1 ATP-binding protein [Ethanoligenens harbinense]